MASRRERCVPVVIATPEGRRVCVRALGVVVGIPPWSADLFVRFDRVVDSGPDVVLEHTDAAGLVSAFTWAVVERTRMLTVHAVVVHGPQGALVLPGPSGLGKSTLALALTQAGFTLMSDEVAAFDLDDAAVHAFPRPVTVDAASAGATIMGRYHDGGGEIVIDSTSLGDAGPPRTTAMTLIVPTRTEAGPARLGSVPDAEGVGSLLRQCFNHYRWPAASLRTIAHVVGGARVMALTYSQAIDAAELLRAEFLGPALTDAS